MKKIINLLVIVIILTFSGYFLFGELISIFSFAENNKNKLIAWSNPVIISNPGATETSQPTVTEGNTILNVEPILDYSGAYLAIDVYIQNNSDYTIIINDIVPKGDISNNIVWEVNPSITNKALAAYEKTKVTIYIELVYLTNDEFKDTFSFTIDNEIKK